MKRKTILFFVMCLILTLTSAGSIYSNAPQVPTVSVGKGGYTLEPMGSQLYDWTLINRADRLPPDTKYVSENFGNDPVPTNDWASSIAWVRYSGALYAHPLSFMATETGFQVSNPPKTVSYPENFANNLGDGEAWIERLHRPGQVDFEVQPTTFQPNAALLDKATDWSVDVLMPSADSSKSMKATIAHGSPYAYFTFDGADPHITFLNAMTVTHDKSLNNYIGVSVNNNGQINDYGIFAPEGSTWNVTSNSITVTLPSGSQFLSIAGLPDGSLATLDYYKDRAYAFITDTQVDWAYDPGSSTVTTTFTVETEAKQGTNLETIFALYPHQWRDNPMITSYLPYEYDSIRGKMKTVTGTDFETRYTYQGILPWLPSLENQNNIAQLETYLTGFYDWGHSLDVPFQIPGLDPGFAGGYDTYWYGKNLFRLGNAMGVANSLGDDIKRDVMLGHLKEKLEWWLTPIKYNENGQLIEDNFFYYNDNWGTLIGYGTAYFADSELNDHHFHYGYYAWAAAQVALMDKEWAEYDEWGGMIEELIVDYANPIRNSQKYPFLRSFDVYAGHSWANGPGFIDAEPWKYAGNNQESSSEAVNSYAALILWGEATGNQEIRDLGIYLYTTEVQAANNYYFDIYGDIFEPEYQNTNVTMLWGGMYTHTAWWTESPHETSGITLLPISPASYYLGTDQQYVKNNYDSVQAERANYLQKRSQYGWATPDSPSWVDIWRNYYALYDPDAALASWNMNVNPEFGTSDAFNYQWIQHLREYGQPNFNITANVPLYQVLSQNGLNTYIAYNAKNEEVTVTFSDCTELILAANSYGFVQGPGSSQVCSVNPPTENPTEPPETPNNLNVLDVTHNSVTLSWSAAKHAKGYEVMRNGAVVGNVTGTSYQDTGLNDNTTYTYTVRAYNTAGVSPVSTSVSATTETANNNAFPQHTHAHYEAGVIMESGTEASLRFEPTSNALYVDVSYKLNGGSQLNYRMNNNSDDSWTTSVQGVNTGDVLEYRFVYERSGAQYETTWFTYTVGEGGNNNPTAPTAPAAPTNLTVTGVTTNSISLNWNTVTHATSYEVLRNGTIVGNTTSTSYLDTGLSEGTSYTYAVRAKNNDGISDNSVSVIGTTESSPSSGDTFTHPDFTASVTLNGSEATITFVPNESMDIVDIHYKVNNNGQQNFRMTKNGDTWQQLVGNLNAGDTLEFSFTYIRNGAGNSSLWYTYTH